MLHAKFQDNWTSDFNFYQIWAWCPSWSCDLGHLYKLSCPIPKKAPPEMALMGRVVSEKIFERGGRTDRRRLYECTISSL